MQKHNQHTFSHLSQPELALHIVKASKRVYAVGKHLLAYTFQRLAPPQVARLGIELVCIAYQLLLHGQRQHIAQRQRKPLPAYVLCRKPGAGMPLAHQGMARQSTFTQTVTAGDAVAYIRQLAITLYVRGIDIDDAYVMQQSRLLHEVSIYSKSVLPSALQSHVGNGSRMCPEYLLQLLLPLYLRVNDRPGKLFIYIHHVKSKNAEDASRPLRTNIITKKYLRYQSMISTQP